MCFMKNSILQEQIQYYRDRATEYDEWFFRQGRYDRGKAHRQQWLAEIAEVEAALFAAKPSGDVLELACGTGLWTKHLASLANNLTAIDAAPEAIAINQQRVGSAAVHYIVADLFNWEPETQFDFVFFSFWLSHVPEDQFVPFWQKVQKSLKLNGRVFLVDGLLNQASTAQNHAPLHQQGYTERKLNDGRIYNIVKVFYKQQQLQDLLQTWGWQGQVISTKDFFLYGLLNMPESKLE
jgi:2-polyprenyl-3-methyl-5-hydroxy-6-metoxy-1,4-benzoquinol methylase